MAFPTIPTVAAGRVLFALATNPAGTHTSPNLSSLTKSAGDLLIAIVIIYDGNSTNAEFSAWGGSFTEFADQAGTATMGIGAAYKWSTGSETGTFTVTTADTSANDSCFILLSIPGAHASNPPEAGTMAVGTAPDSGALNPAGWGTEDTLWIAVGASGEDTTGGSYTGIGAAPTSYTDQADSGISADAVGGVEGSVAFRQLNAASEDPGTWSMDTTNARGASLLIAVCPVISVLHQMTATDSVTTSESMSRLGTFLRTTTDSVTSSNAVDRLGTFLRSMADSITNSDTVEGLKVIVRSAVDAIATSESTARLGTFLRTTTDSVASSNAAERVLSAVRIATDSATYSEVAERLLSAVRTAVDAITTSESVTGLKVTIREAVDAITTSDSAARVLSLVRTVTDGQTYSDAAVRLLTVARSAVDSVTTSEAITSLKVILRSATDAIATSEVAERFLTVVRTATDASTYSDAAARVLGAVRAATDALATSDVATRTLSIARSAVDAITTSEAAAAIVSGLASALGWFTQKGGVVARAGTTMRQALTRMRSR